MKNKFIILLTLIFFLSTTGLPISLHYCQMQGSASLSDCEMCAPEETEEASSCCEKEDDYPVQIAAKNLDECCVTQIIESSVKDNFLLNKSEVKSELKNFSIPLNSNNVFYSNKFDKAQLSYSDSSPPLLKSELYILNSILLI